MSAGEINAFNSKSDYVKRMSDTNYIFVHTEQRRKTTMYCVSHIGPTIGLKYNLFN